MSKANFLEITFILKIKHNFSFINKQKSFGGEISYLRSLSFLSTKVYGDRSFCFFNLRKDIFRRVINNDETKMFIVFFYVIG